MSLLQVSPGPPLCMRLAELAGQTLIERSSQLDKQAASKQAFGEPVYNMAGTLYLSKGTNFILLSVPNALVHGSFSAMHEPGLELPPPGPGGRMEAHVTVMHPEELELLGGADKVSERGKQFRYSLGRLKWV